MYAIKIMSSENKADSDVGKGYKIILVDAGDTFEFGHDPDTGKPQVTVTGVREGEATYITYPVTGNCYVLSSTGKTIASFWGRSLWETPSMDNEPEFEVISGADEPCRQIKITLDPRDTQPERTIEAIQAMVANYAKKAPPTGDNCVELRKRWEEQGLTSVQVMLLQQERKPLCNNPADRDKAFRANVGTLMANGIPVSIAMEESMYLLGDIVPTNRDNSQAALLKHAAELGLSQLQLDLIKETLLKRPVGTDTIKNDCVMRDEIAYLVKQDIPILIAQAAAAHLNGISRLDESMYLLGEKEVPKAGTYIAAVTMANAIGAVKECIGRP